MATGAARVRAGYEYPIKVLLIGDTGVGKSGLLLRFSHDSFITKNDDMITIGFRTIELDGKRIKLKIWGLQERVRTFATACYRRAMGALLVYNVTDESSFKNIRKWIKIIEQHASDDVSRILIGNKVDMDETKRAVPTARGQALADEFGIKFFETSAKTNFNVEDVLFCIARDIKQHLAGRDLKPKAQGTMISKPDDGVLENQKRDFFLAKVQAAVTERYRDALDDEVPIWGPLWKDVCNSEIAQHRIYDSKKLFKFLERFFSSDTLLRVQKTFDVAKDSHLGEEYARRGVYSSFVKTLIFDIRKEIYSEYNGGSGGRRFGGTSGEGSGGIAREGSRGTAGKRSGKTVGGGRRRGPSGNRSGGTGKGYSCSPSEPGRTRK